MTSGTGDGDPGSTSSQSDALISASAATNGIESNGKVNANGTAFDDKTRELPVLAAPPTPRARNQAAAHNPTASPLVGAAAAANVTPSQTAAAAADAAAADADAALSFSSGTAAWPASTRS